MSASPHDGERLPADSSYSSSSSSESLNVSLAGPPPHSRLPNRHGMDRWQGRQFSQSTPALVNNAEDSTSGGDRTGDVTTPRPRHHSAIASHFLAQPADTFGGQTWMDFLRESGAEDRNQQPRNNIRRSPGHPRSASASYSYQGPRQQSRGDTLPYARNGDRRRHTMLSGPPARQSSSQSVRPGDVAGSVAPGSSAPPIVGSPPHYSSPPHGSLPPRPSLHPYPSQSSFDAASRRSSDIVLPPWQADSEVTHCPVCSRQFTFFYRKHHCRKCGRVVCAACSPHRITIPRQFIVQPPSPTSSAVMAPSYNDQRDRRHSQQDLADFLQGRHSGNNAGTTHEGFEGQSHTTAVVSNSIPPTNTSTLPDRPTNPYNDRRSLSMHDLARELGSYNTNSQHLNPALGGGETVRVCNPCVPDPNFSPPPQQPVHDPPPYPGPPGTPESPRYINQSHHRAGNHPVIFRSGPGEFQNPPQGPPRSAIAVQYNSQPQHRTVPSPSLDQRNMYSRSAHDPQSHERRRHSVRFVAQSPVAALPARPPPREVAEEDECPVCGRELPPMGSDGDDAARVQHINDCISGQFSSPAGPSARQSAMPAGKLVWIASEKDCISEDGEQVECVICLEEFAAGDRMARLRCLCKFHDVCITDWWATKGVGACPTHQLHE